MHMKKLRILALSVMILIMTLVCGTVALAEDAAAQISGNAWLDKDVNGVNNSESALSNVHITLESVHEDGSVHPVAETETGADGFYLFGSLADGDYRLTVELPADHQFTYHGTESAILPASGNVSYSPVFTIENGESKSMNIGGTKSRSYIQVVAFEDENANGGRMSSENLVRNVQVELLYEYEGVVYSICQGTTNKEGALKLDDLTPGTYYAAVTLPENFIFGPLGQKINNFYNCVPPTENGYGETEPFEVPAKDSMGLGVGVVKTGALEGSVWYDENANGLRDANEGSYAGLELVLYATDLGITRTTYSGEDGVYRFDNLQEGAYELTANLSDGVMFAAGQSIFTDYGLARNQTAQVSVRVQKTASVDPIGVMPDTTITFRAFEDVDGNNVYDAAENGGADMPFAGAVFTAVLANGQEVSVTTDENGLAVLGNVRGGNLQLSCQLPEGYIFVHSSSDIPFSANVGISSMAVSRAVTDGQNTTVDAVVTKPVSITGTLFEDDNTDGLYADQCAFLEGFTVQAVSSFGDVMGEAVTDENGCYAFTNLLPGEYTIRINLTDPYIASSYAADLDGAYVNTLHEQTMDYANTLPFALLPGESARKDAAVFKAGTVDGYVLLNPNYDALATNAGGLAGVTVQLLDEFGAPVSDYSYDVTDENGYFYIKGILPGTYALSYTMPSDAALTLPMAGATELQTESFSVENGDAIHCEHVGAVKTCSISGFIMHKTAADTTLPMNAVVRLIPAQLETTYETETLENGEYVITDILPGIYTMEVELPEGYVFDHAATSPVPAALTNISTATLDLTMGEVITEAHIAAALPAQFQGKMYFDLDASKLLTESEPAISAHQIILANANGDSYTAVTDENGYFQFPELLPGAYTATFTLDDDCIVSGNGQKAGDQWQVEVMIADGDMNASANIGILRYASVSGSVWSMDGTYTGVSGLTIQLEKEGEPVNQVVTDESGAFSFTQLYPGIYTVSTTLPDGYLFARTVDTHSRQSLVLEGDSIPFEVTMGAAVQACDIGIGAVGSIGDTAWLDENKNGMQDLDEVGMPGIVIELYQYGELAATTTTDVYGRYQLTDLFPGTYSMVVTMPEELKPTLQQNEFPLLRSILPASEESCVTVENVIVPSGDTDLNWDLGFALRTDGVYPDAMNQIPSTNWMPYSER